MTEFITPNLVGFIAPALFMWKITRDISGMESPEERIVGDSLTMLMPDEILSLG